MASISVSPLVFKQTSRREDFSPETILRAALNIKTEGFTASDGTHFPEGTAFVAWYKERALSALVKNGSLFVEGKFYNSLSAAAAHYTGRPTTNGWTFWLHKLPRRRSVPSH